MTLSIAIPKGRLGAQVIKVLNSVNLYKDIVDNSSRKLVFFKNDENIVFNMVKNADVTTYVEEKVFDIGFTGMDMVMENKPNVYILDRLNIGVCKLSIAALSNNKDFKDKRLIRVATSYPTISKDYFKDKGIDINIMNLNGSVELAPVLGLSDVIVDIVETGNTLRENGLEVVEDMYEISCALIANKISYKFKRKEIDEFINNFKSGGAYEG